MVIFQEGLVGIAKNYLKKGAKIYLEGQLQTRKWTDKDGQEKYSTEVVLQGFNGVLTMLDNKGSGDNSAGNSSGYGQSYSAPTTSAAPKAPAELMDDEIPF